MSLEEEMKNYKKMLTYSASPEIFMKEVLGLDVEWFHKEWIDLIENNNYVSILAPRGHGKSTIIGAYVIWRILQNPNIRILQVTINQDKANEMMSFVQNALDTNEIIKDIWGELRNPNEWSKSSIRVLRRGHPGVPHKEPTLQVLGVTSSMVGGHYDLIILDDITDGKNSRTEYRRQELVRWYNMTLLPMLEPDCKIISIGTKWHELDIHSYFQNRTNYKSKIYRAIIFEPDEEQKKQNMGPQVLWPNRWTYDKLMEIKSQAGTVGFYMQYQNEVVSAEDALIKWDQIRRSQDNYIMPPKPYEIYMGVDLASKGEETDYFALSVIAIKEGDVFLVDAFRGDLTMAQQFTEVLKMDRKWRPLRIGIDSAAQQKSIVEHLMEQNPGLPVIPVKPSITNDRMSRVQRLSVLFETNRIFMNPEFTVYGDELSMFPRGAHDDAIDSLSFALEAAHFNDGQSNIDWSIIPNLISTGKKSTVLKPTTRRRWDVIKV
jgi:predicted phage terminase large subunit-like protein